MWKRNDPPEEPSPPKKSGWIDLRKIRAATSAKISERLDDRKEKERRMKEYEDREYADFREIHFDHEWAMVEQEIAEWADVGSYSMVFFPHYEDREQPILWERLYNEILDKLWRSGVNVKRWDDSSCNATIHWGYQQTYDHVV